VEHYQRGVFSDAHELMRRAKQELLKCDALLIDISENPSGGAVIEAGVAIVQDKRDIIDDIQGRLAQLLAHDFDVR
jgi:hypothetical protein